MADSGNSTYGTEGSASYDPNAPANASISSPTYSSQDNGVSLTGPQGGDYGYNAAAPGAGENYANSALNYYGAGNIPGATQNTQGAYQQFQQSTPADTSPYYNEAMRESNNAINTAAAARGSLGSSGAVGQIASADANITGQEALANANYGLQRAQTAGSLASGADQSSVAASNNQLGWTQGLGQLAAQGQELGQNRFQQNYQNTMGLAGTLSGMENQTYGAEDATDQTLMDNGMNAYTGGTVQGATDYNNQVTAASNNTDQEINDGTKILGAVAGV